MRALILAPFSSQCLKELGEHLSIFYESWTETRKLYDPQELAARIREEEVQVVVVEADFLFRETFEEAPTLRLAGLCRNQLNHVDLDAATEHGVLVVNTPGRNAQGVAEHTLGLILALARRTPEAHRYVMEGRWENPVEPYLSMRGIELAGKTAGIVGLGNIGRRVAHMAKCLDMRVLAYDPYVKEPPPGVTLVNLAELLKRSDFVTIHVPSTPEMEGLIDASSLSLMKPTAFLVNTSGPFLVDRKALALALEEKRIAGAAVDVFETHPISPQDPLLKLGNVILTPHIGGATDGTVERHSRMITEDVKRFIQGKRPKNLVNPEAWRKRG